MPHIIRYMSIRNFFCCFILLFLTEFTMLSAQNIQPTPYQKKQLELSKKYFEILYGYKMSMLDEVFYDELAQGKDVQEFLLALGLMNYSSNHSEAQLNRLLSQMEADFNQAKTLISATDLRLEREAKRRAEQAAFDKTEVGTLYKKIKSDFEVWNNKGEFEMEIDYALRLQNKSQTVFDSICFNQIKLGIENVKSMYWQKELSTYNTEGEYFPVALKINGVKWQSKLKVSISKAENLKNAWPDFNFIVDDKDWCYLNNSLSPTIVNAHNRDINSQYKFTLPKTNQSEILVLFDKLGITNTYLSGYVFNYATFLAKNTEIHKENQRLDSLEIVIYNQKIDSIFQSYNVQLLNNPYNTTRKQMIKFDKIDQATEDREEKYNNNLESIKLEYERINNGFERELKSKYPSEYCKIYYSLNLDKKTEAEKKYLECRCSYSQRLKFDLAFIEGILNYCNCRKDAYQKSGSLFYNEAEFDSFYDQGDDVLNKEVHARILKQEENTAINKIMTNVSEIKKLNFKDAKSLISKEELSSYYYKDIDSYKDKPYFAKIIDVLIQNNKDLNKEWEKKGEMFLNQVEFYHAYTSGEYKQILKQKSIK